MGGHNIFALIFILILAFLFINNAANTNTVVAALGGQSVNIISTLQGR